MALIEQTDPVNQIEILSNGILQIREATIVQRDGVEIARTYHRYAMCPGDDLASKDPRIVAVAAAVWTAEVVVAYAAAASAQTAT